MKKLKQNEQNVQNEVHLMVVASIGFRLVALAAHRRSCRHCTVIVCAVCETPAQILMKEMNIRVCETENYANGIEN